MSERRKPSTRYRGQPPPKRRASTSPPLIIKKTPSGVAVDNENGLPTKLKDPSALPTSSKPIAFDQSSAQLQGIPESGVLATSIARSRQRWLMDSVFEKYWTKPSKKKGLIEPQNPARESMTKIGFCSMVIEPHVFDVTLYSVKESQYTFLPPVNQHPLQIPIQLGPTPLPTFTHGSPKSHSLAPLPAQLPPQGQRKPQANNLQPILPGFREGFAQFEPQGLSQSIPGSSSEPIHNPLPPMPHISPSQSIKKGSSSADQDGSTNTDPVIQMLAARAATDPDLKSLMKIVAQGKASSDQLRVFQNHIDEFNNIIQSQKALPLPNSPQIPVPEVRTGADSTQSNSVSSHPPKAVHPAQPIPVIHPTQLLPAPIVKTELPSQYFSQPPQYLKPKASISLRQDVAAIAFEFSPGNGDRFLIPKYSILEYLPGDAQVLVSFLITRKGNAAASGKYKSSIEYYQPITLRLSSHNFRHLEPLNRAVAPPDEVKKYMAHIMNNMTLAEDVYLITQLPGASEVSESKEPAVDMNPDVPRRIYSPPNFLFPLNLTAKS